jgi:hypothetical protein
MVVEDDCQLSHRDHQSAAGVGVQEAMTRADGGHVPNGTRDYRCRRLCTDWLMIRCELHGPDLGHALH